MYQMLSTVPLIQARTSCHSQTLRGKGRKRARQSRVGRDKARSPLTSFQTPMPRSFAIVTAGRSHTHTHVLSTPRLARSHGVRVTLPAC